ncbi:hypothetical protein [Chelativorans sp. AA-79]|uniref:hypothetical protein n=1 Tax=Chelativorans sp. AA-79 TaxID=3028735 RepID=UPI0023F988D6|nr:hypothetical protein [Chelativorans sp. AA-79]WEX08549.1 hypothetical protein PVE73_21150 [Chelativorans sp. AA-79]
MTNGTSFSQRWQEYRPSKAIWAWSCIASVVLTMIVGFTYGGWVTGGTAESMAAQAKEDARENLVANLCVDGFVSSVNAEATFADIKEASSWDRDNLIEEGGWATIDGLEEQVAGAADLCAERIANMEDLPADRVVGTSDNT